MGDERKSVGERARERARVATEVARRKGDDLRTSNERIGSAADKLDRGLKDVNSKLGRELGRQAEKLSLGEYRSELDAALDQALEVVAAQAAEIEALRIRLGVLEGGAR